jgi:hypothetical protein
MKNGLMKSHEFLLAATLYVSEHDYASPFIRAFVFENGNEYESVVNALAAINGPIPVRQIEVKMTTEEFLDLFKRFDVTLTWHGLELEGRDFSTQQTSE